MDENGFLPFFLTHSSSDEIRLSLSYYGGHIMQNCLCTLQLGHADDDGAILDYKQTVLLILYVTCSCVCV